jgi:hypothetical protein
VLVRLDDGTSNLPTQVSLALRHGASFFEVLEAFVVFGRRNEEQVVSEVQRQYMLLLQLIARLLRTGCGGLGWVGVGWE